MGELGVTPPDFARQLAPLAGFRNILIHEYLTIDWDIIYQRLHNLDNFEQFGMFVRVWLGKGVDN